VVAETAADDARYDEERTGLKKLAAELGVIDRVRFMGTVAAEKLPAVVRSADVVACTPRQAPRATTALQAMASGVAVVATSVGALADTVVNSVTGRLVSPTNPNELVAALKDFQTQGFQRASMGAAGRSRAASRFTWDRIARDALNIYHHATSQHLPHNKLAATRGRSTSGEHRVPVR
jgi:glycosyltransferase involved in cell wall biosynthesis